MRGDYLQGTDNIVQIGERLSHSHKDDIPDFRISFYRADLIDDLGRREVASQPERTRQAEFARHGAPHLTGQAECRAVLFGDQHRFDSVAVRQAKQILSGAVPGDLHSLGSKRADTGRVLQLAPKLPGKVGHFREGGGILLIEPLENLPGAIPLFTATRNECLKPFQVIVFQICLFHD